MMDTLPPDYFVSNVLGLLVCGVFWLFCGAGLYSAILLSTKSLLGLVVWQLAEVFVFGLAGLAPLAP